MELQFQKKPLDSLKSVVREVRSSEQTQELKLPEGMPDVGRVISSWGQPILRGKEWHSTDITASGGMMVWVLYAPDGEGQPQVLSSWIPFQLRWELPGDTGDGDIRISLLTRFVDARSVSPRKLMVRAGIGALAEAYVRDSVQVHSPETTESNAELLTNRYPVRLRKEAGEKTFLLDEELSLPESVPAAQTLIYCTLEPKLFDSRVLSDKLAFRGAGKLHLLFQSPEGQLHNWDFEVPFSQYAELPAAFGSDAQGDVRFAVTSMEPELMENGRLRLKAGLVSQYVICDREMVEVVEDAYSPRQELQLQQEELQLPVILENARENLYGEQTIHADADVAVDARFLPDFPQLRKNGDQTELVYPGNFQVLYYGPDRQLYGAGARWEGQEKLDVSSDLNMAVYPQPPETQAAAGNGSITVKTEFPAERTSETVQQIPMVTRIQGGPQRQQDPGRPSLVLRRAGGDRLWDLAKQSSSTVQAIREANGLEGEPEPGRMLLIPVQ